VPGARCQVRYLQNYRMDAATEPRASASGCWRSAALALRGTRSLTLAALSARMEFYKYLRCQVRGAGWAGEPEGGGNHCGNARCGDMGKAGRRDPRQAGAGPTASRGGRQRYNAR